MSDNYKRIAVDNDTDGIFSRLPRNLIDSILERMPIRDAARTSILSKKWRYISSAHPYIVLDKHFFMEFRNKPFYYEQYFLSAIQQILLLHNGPILKFVLYIPNIECDWDLHISQWLLFLTRNGIKELNLENRKSRRHKLPSSVFSCPELTHLNLCHFIFKPPDAFGGFPNLISLSFEKIIFASNIFGTLIPSMPLLETLNFTYCSGIHYVIMHAPKLERFRVRDSTDVTSICFKSFPNLTKVSIVLANRVFQRGMDRTVNLSKYFDHLPRISKLCFDGNFLKVLSAGIVPGKLSIPLDHLKHLVFHKLRFDDLDQTPGVLFLLRSSPNLRKLDISAFSGEGATELNSSYLEASGCMHPILNQLRTVSITSVKGSRAELHFIKCILANSPLLERVLVNYHGIVNVYEGFKISTELMRFSRASPKAEIVYTKGKVM